MWTGNPYLRLKQEWDPADTMFDLFCAMLGVSFGIMLVYILNSPRLVRYPYAEVVTMKRDYGLDCIREEKMELFTKHVPREIKWIAWKYWIEMFIITYIPSRVFTLFPDNTVDTNPGPLIEGLFREDWLLYFLIQIMCIGLCFIWNWTSNIEQQMLWNNNFIAYGDFLLAWGSVFGIFMATSI